MKLRVLLLEDDYLQRKDICNAVEAELDAEVDLKSTESDFRSSFEEIAANPPDVAVLDIMVRWANPSRHVEPEPAEVSKKPEIAGLRCAELLRKDTRTQSIKVIVYSVLGPEDIGGGEIPEGVASVVKETDFRDLIEKIRELIGLTV